MSEELSNIIGKAVALKTGRCWCVEDEKWEGIGHRGGFVKLYRCAVCKREDHGFIDPADQKGS